jgi:hypothetical protein
MPIPPPVKAVLRKDLLLGGAAGTALCAALVGAALTIGPLLGIDWPGADSSPTAEAANLPAAPRVSNPSAEALRAQVRAPRIVASTRQPTTRVTAPSSAARTPGEANAPSIVGRTPQTTTAPPVTPRSSSTGAPDAVAVPAPEATPAPAPVATPAALAAAIPVTPIVPATPVGKKLTLHVASVAVVPDDNGSPQLRLSLALERDATVSGAAVPNAVTVTLRPQLPTHAASTGPLALRTVVDVVDAPAVDSSGDGSASVAGMQMRVRMALAPTTTDAPAPTVADGGETDGQSNAIAVDVPLVAFVDPEDHSGPEPAEPAEPGAPAAVPAPPTEIRLDLTPAADPDAHPATETATVPAPDAPAAEHAPADVPVVVVVDSAPAPDPAPAPAPPADPAPAPDAAPAPPADTTAAPADTTAAPADPSTAPADTTPPPAATVTAEATTPAPDPAAAPPYDPGS